MSLKIQRLPFHILASSGFDEDFPPEGLCMDHSPSTKGWQSERFCIYPQALILAFNHGACRIQKIQILGHHFKIPKRLEFHIGQAEQDPAHPEDPFNETPSIQFKQLGYVRMQDNSENNYKVRELKSIHVDAEGTHLKILIHKCHINSLNLYNQTGIIAINVLGQVVDSDFIVKTITEKRGIHYGIRHSDKDLVMNGFVNNDAIDKRISILNDLAFDMTQDPEMTRFLASISRAKEFAVKDENYSLAKALKILFEGSKRAGDRIAQIQLTKELEIHQENFENAEKLKLEIDNIKLNIRKNMTDLGLETNADGNIVPLGSQRYDSKILYEKSTSGSLHTSSNTLSSSVISKSMDTLASSQPDISSKSPKPLSPIQSKSDNPLNECVKEDANKTVTNEEPKIPASAPAQLSIVPNTKPASVPKPAIKTPVANDSPFGISLVGPVDDIPLKKPSELVQPNYSTAGIGELASPVIPKVNNGNLVQGLPQGLEDPGPLSIDQQGKYSIAIDVFGLILVQCAITIKFKCKEWSLAELVVKLNEWDTKSEKLDRMQGKKSPKKDQTPNPGDWIQNTDLITLVRASIQIISYCMDDTREKTTLLTLQLWDRLMDIIEKYNSQDVPIFGNIRDNFQLLFSKAGDTNPRIKVSGVDLLKKIMKIYHQDPTTILPELLQPLNGKKGAPIHPKVIKARLEILKDALSEYKMSKREGKIAKSGLSAHVVLKFAMPFIENSNNEVRELGYTIVAIIGKEIGLEELEKNTTGLREAQKAILLEKIGPIKKSKKSITSDTETDHSIKTAKSNKTDTDTKIKVKKLSTSKKVKTKTMTDDEQEPVKKSKKEKTKETSPELIKRDKKEIKEESKKKSEKKAHEEEPEGDTDSPPKNTCIFCHEQNKDFTQENLEKHYAKDCPFLVSCKQCKLLVEVPTLYSHLHGSCELAPPDLKHCERCNQLVPTKDYKAHIAKRKCKLWNASHDPAICGLCGAMVVGQDGWKDHLCSTETGCPEHPHLKKKNRKVVIKS